MLVIRLARTGRRNQPKFRVVVAEHSKPLDGKTVEIVGHYDPAAPDKPFVVNKEAISSWIEKGAKPSNTVARLLNKYEEFTLPVEQRPARKPKKQAKEIEEKAAPVGEATSDQPPATSEEEMNEATSDQPPANQ